MKMYIPGTLLLSCFLVACGGDETAQSSKNWDETFGNKPGGESVVTLGTSTLELPYIISDGMVLQQESDAVLWGRATPGARVSVKPSWAADSSSVIVGSDGAWKLTVHTPAASGTAHSLRFSDSQHGVKNVSNVLSGEVWLTAGQSNMEHPMRGFNSSSLGYQPIENYEEELSSTDIPTFRYFKDKYQLSWEPCFNTKASTWDACNPTNAREYQAVAFFFGRKLSRDLNVPIGIIGCAYGGSRIEAFMSDASLQKFPASDWKDANDLGLADGETNKQAPTNIYNGMVLPIINYTVRGILWYQGESNRDNFAAYSALQQEMVRDWRELKGDTENKIPFYSVQLAAFTSSDELGAPRVRDAQMDAYDNTPNSGIVNASDCGGPTIHYPDKKTPAERLALWAENKLYNKTTVNPMAPRFESLSISGSKAIVTLSNASGLHLAEGKDKVENARICGADGTWYDADVTISGEQLIFSCASVAEPAHVRYCYASWSVGGNLYNADGLPVFPFQY